MKTYFAAVLLIAAFGAQPMAVAQAGKVAVQVGEHLLGPTARDASHAAAEGLSRVAAVEGEAAARQAAHGVEAQLAKAAAEHGEIVLKLARRVPEAAVPLAQRAPQLLPLAERFGDDILRIEARATGFAEQAAKSFNQAEMARLVKLPVQDMKAVISMATHATEPRAAQLLLEGAEKGGSRFLEKISAKQIVAAGLSVAVVTAAFRAADIIEQSPDKFVDGAVRIAQIVLQPVGYAVAGLLALVFGLKIWRRHRRAAAQS